MIGASHAILLSLERVRAGGSQETDPCPVLQSWLALFEVAQGVSQGLVICVSQVGSGAYGDFSLEVFISIFRETVLRVSSPAVALCSTRLLANHPSRIVGLLVVVGCSAELSNSRKGVIQSPRGEGTVCDDQRSPTALWQLEDALLTIGLVLEICANIFQIHRSRVRLPFRLEYCCIDCATNCDRSRCRHDFVAFIVP